MARLTAGVVPVATFAEWLSAQMTQRGIRSGRRLALEARLEEQQLLDWVIGRRVPQPQDVDRLARFFGVASAEAQFLRQRSEQAMPARGRR